MAFQVKDFRSIVASMLNHLRSTQNRLTDFNVGSVARSLVEAPAIEIDELYQQMFIGLKEAIPVATFNSFGFPRLSAVAASGRIRITLTPSDEDVLVSAGTRFAVIGEDLSYLSVGDVTVPAGSTVADILVRAAAPGRAGNISAGKQFELQPGLATLVGATNPSAIVNGEDAESDSARKIRFARYIAALQRGTVAAIEYGLTTAQLVDADGEVTERVRFASVVEPYKDDPTAPISLVQSYLHNGSAPVSSALLEEAQRVIHGYTREDGVKVAGWKSAGVHVEIYPATEKLVGFSGTLAVERGFHGPTVAAQATERASSYIQALAIGDTAIAVELIALIKRTPGVYNFLPDAPLEDVPSAHSEKIMPGLIELVAAP